MLIGFSEDMTFIDIELFRSKVKVRRVTFVKTKWFPLFILKTIYHRAFIFYMLIGRRKDMTSIDFEFIRFKVKVTRVTCLKKEKMLTTHYLENCLSETFNISHADWS